MIASAYEEAKQILRQNREKLDKLASLLIEKEVMFREDLEAVFGPRPGIPGKEEEKPEEEKAE